MKIFLVKVVFFASASLFLILTIGIAASKIVASQAIFAARSETKYVIFGHSHPEVAFNDAYISNFQNFSKSSEPYMYILPKVKNLIHQNPNIEVVFIEFTNDQIMEGWDRRIGSSRLMNEWMPLYGAFLEASDLFFLFRGNPIGLVEALTISFRIQFKKMWSRKYPAENIGGYFNLERDNTDSLLQSLTESGHDEIESGDERLSEYHIQCLKRIAAFCRNSRKKVFLVRSPQHPSWIRRKNESLFQQVRKETFRDLDFLDFNDFPISNSEFGDLRHLNHRGAYKFSVWFNQLLEDGLLDRGNKSDYIEKKIREMDSTLSSN